MERNSQIEHPNTIRVGQRLTLPRTAQNTTGSEEGSSGTMEEGTKGMKGSTGTEEGTKGDMETAPEQVAPNPEEGSQPLKNQDTDQNQESGQGTTGTSK